MTSSTAMVLYVYTAPHHLQTKCSEVCSLLSVLCEVCPGPGLCAINQAVAHRGVALTEMRSILQGGNTSLFFCFGSVPLRFSCAGETSICL